MRCFVTGGAGFIGSHLVEHLLGLGYETVVLDDLSTSDMANLANVAGHRRLRFVRGSVCDSDTVRDCMDGVDAIYHLAAAVGVFNILDKPLAGIRTNLHGTETVLDAALRHDVPILIVSTSEVYGKNTSERLAENDERIIGSPLITRWSYAEAKALDETLAYLYHVEHGVRSVIVRLFNTVGPRQTGRYGMVVPRFVGQALAGEPLTIFGDGQQVRCFCHVLDVVPALISLLGDERSYGDVYNLGNPEQTTISQLAERVVAATDSRSPIVKVPYKAAYGDGFEDTLRRVPDCRKIRELIGFHPQRDLGDIIRSVIADHHGHLHQAHSLELLHHAPDPLGILSWTESGVLPGILVDRFIYQGLRLARRRTRTHDCNVAATRRQRYQPLNAVQRLQEDWKRLTAANSACGLPDLRWFDFASALQTAMGLC
jgi:UDP-glucose 4-epimerase